MFPFIQLGSWQISVNSLIDALALTLAGTWSFYRLLRLNRPVDVIVGGLFLTIVSGFVGTVLTTYLVNALRVVLNGPLAHQETLSISRGLMCSIGVAAIYCWKYKISLGRAFDLVAPPVLLGLAFARLGCLAAGCCYGKPTDSWLGMVSPDVNGVWAARYPTQLMSAAANLLIFITLVVVERRATSAVESGSAGWPFNGLIALLAIALYSLKRFLIAFLREGGAVPILGPLSMMHLEALVGLTVAAALIVINLHRIKKEET